MVLGPEWGHTRYTEASKHYVTVTLATAGSTAVMHSDMLLFVIPADLLRVSMSYDSLFY